jgi:SAM-dependent methyltransferase
MKKISSEENTLKNEKYYDRLYSTINVSGILNKVRNLEKFMKDAITTDTSWVGLYYNNFQKDLKGKIVLEIGCGDCTNAAIMSALGAEVYANDISQKSGLIIDELNANYKFDAPIKFVNGNFLMSRLPDNFFDYVIGKAFVHHLTHEQEIQFTKKIIKTLKPEGKVRFFEPAVNNKILDRLRWIVPVPGRPSILQKEKYKKWQENDPHPIRDNSDKHYRLIGMDYYNYTDIIPIGCIERFHRLLPRGKFNRSFRRFAFKAEKFLPLFIRLSLARSQLIIYGNPKK